MNPDMLDLAVTRRRTALFWKSWTRFAASVTASLHR